MVKLVWDKEGERLYETGASKAVIYVKPELGGEAVGVAWNGLTAVRQSPDGAEETPLFADNIKYLSMTGIENFKGTIEAYTYPEEFMECDGSKSILAGVNLGQQTRKPFDMAYSTIVGNDVLGNDYGEKIHLIYGAKVTPSDRAYETVNDDPNAITFAWDFGTTPQDPGIEGFKPTAYVVVDKTKVGAVAFKKLQDMLYGDGVETAKMPKITELVTLLTVE